MGVDITFWGVRGSIPCPAPEYMIYGGNTACVELCLDGKVIIIDAGSGIRDLGKDLSRRGVREAVMLISHTHWDHINGFPFFMFAYQADAVLDMYAAFLGDGSSAKGVFELQMSDPFFPMPMHTLQSTLNFHNFTSGASFELYGGEVKVETAPLNHPNGATGYRITYKDKSVAYISDTEHVPGQEDENVLRLIRGCDFVIFDALFTEDEFTGHIGWGHSTWEEAARLARKEKIKHLALFHHSPEHKDDEMARIEEHIRGISPNYFVAKEKMRFTIE